MKNIDSASRQRLNFRIRTMFDSYLPTVVCRRSHVFFMVFVLVAYNGVYVLIVCMSNMAGVL